MDGWTWELCDLNQGVLAALDDRRPGAEVTMGVNVGRTAKCSISKEDPAFELASVMDTIVKVTSDDWTDPVFCGRVVLPEATESESGEAIDLNAVDPLFMLERAFVHKAPEAIFTTTGILVLSYLATDQSTIMWNLIDHAQDNGVDAGIADGSRPATVNRDRYYPTGKQIAEAVVQMSQVDGGPDFELAPVSATDGTLAEFNTHHPKLGSDLTADVIFHTGQSDADDTARELRVQPSGEQIFNRAIVVGSITDLSTFGIISIADHAGSQAIYGVTEFFEVRTDIITFNGLAEYCKGIVRANAMPVEFLEFTASLDGPRFGPGSDGVYYLGDTVAVDVYPRLGGNADTISGRVMDATLTEDEGGNVEVHHVCAPESVSSGSITENHYYVQLMDEVEAGPS